MRRLGGAERLIRGEAIRFMQQQRSDEQRSKWAMVLYEQPEEIPQPESSSSEPSPSAPALTVLEEIMLKYGYTRSEPPVRVRAVPIPPSAPTSTPASPLVKFSKTRVKRAVKKGTGISEPADSEEESENQASTFQSSVREQAQKVMDDIPPEVVVKLEVEDLTPEELERFNGNNKLTFEQFTVLDADRANALAKEKGKGKGKTSLAQDPDFPVWNVKISNIHLPHGVIPINETSLGSSSSGLSEADDLRRAIVESLELERIRKEKEARELQEILAQIDQQEMDEAWARVEEEYQKIQREKNNKRKP